MQHQASDPSSPPGSQVVELVNPQGRGPALILCEHACKDIPDRYDRLGLRDSDRDSHAAWDPGARAIALTLSQALESPMVASRVSRLVYDCNRPPDAPDAMPARSELIDVPGNADLTAAQRAERTAQIYDPFCTTVSEVIARRQADARPTVLITIHSFTPVYFGKPRAVEIGILHDDDRRMADLMLAEAPRLPHRQVVRNAPYGPQDGVTHSLKLHGLGNGLANVMIEVRNDLVTTTEEENAMARDLLALINPALDALLAGGGDNA
ncbi:N-formylglutamate amidohydrolase [Rhodobacteraceae bacterium M382]|nr:N-formylglutamate amidohydrolase [Rhodobacteraceae bacterium M382]